MNAVDLYIDWIGSEAGWDNFLIDCTVVLIVATGNVGDITDACVCFSYLPDHLMLPKLGNVVRY